MSGENTSLPYGPPKQVSPLIRGLRWGLFVAGFFYARSKQALYNKLEANYRIEEAKRKEKRDKEKAIMKAKLLEEERHTLKLLETGELFETDAKTTKQVSGGDQASASQKKDADKVCK